MRERPAPGDADRFTTQTLVVVVVSVSGSWNDVAADLTGREPRGVDVCVRPSGANRSEQFLEFAGGDPLRCGPDDIGRPEGAAHGSGDLRAGLRTGGAVA